MRIPNPIRVAAAGLAFIILAASSNAKAQSVEEAYDATLDAYNQTLNQMEECDLKFQEFQQVAKNNRPADGASKEDWDEWAKAYIFSVGMYRLCIDRLKREADNLRKKLDELEEQLDGAGSSSETKPTRKEPSDKEKKAPGLLKKGNEDLEKWTIGVRYKIKLVNDWSPGASEDVREHGSGKFKIEPRFEYRF
jgi:hypothetical protein